MLVKWVFRVIRDYLMPIAFGGLIGGLLVGAFLIWPKVYGASWWEAFTAIGTVGAAIGAVWMAVYNRWLYEKDEQRKLLFDIKSLVIPGLESLERKIKWAAFHTPEANARYKADIDEELRWLDSIDAYRFMRHHEGLYSELLALKLNLNQLSKDYRDQSHNALNLLPDLRKNIPMLRERIESILNSKGLSSDIE